MKHPAFDMNLLKVMSVLFEERSVTRTGERLGRTQSAISNSLKRLRQSLNDPLFVPGRDGLELTPRAAMLEDQVKQIIGATDQFLAEGELFEPETAVGRCRLGAPDRMSLPLVLPLLNRLRDQAPGIALDIVTTDGESALAMLDSGHLDIAIGWFDNPPTRFRADFLFDEGFVCLCRPDHPLLAADTNPGMSALLTYSHVMVSAAGSPKAVFDLMLERVGAERDIMVSVTNFSMVPNILHQSDMVGVFTERVATLLARDNGLAALAVPLEIEPLSHFMVWHGRNDADPQQRWIRGQVKILENPA